MMMGVGRFADGSRLPGCAYLVVQQASPPRPAFSSTFGEPQASVAKQSTFQSAPAPAPAPRTEAPVTSAMAPPSTAPAPAPAPATRTAAPPGLAPPLAQPQVQAPPVTAAQQQQQQQAAPQLVGQMQQAAPPPQQQQQAQHQHQHPHQHQVQQAQQGQGPPSGANPAPAPAPAPAPGPTSRLTRPQLPDQQRQGPPMQQHYDQGLGRFQQQQQQQQTGSMNGGYGANTGGLRGPLGVSAVPPTQQAAPQQTAPDLSSYQQYGMQQYGMNGGHYMQPYGSGPSIQHGVGGETDAAPSYGVTGSAVRCEALSRGGCWIDFLVQGLTRGVPSVLQPRRVQSRSVVVFAGQHSGPGGHPFLWPRPISSAVS
jgi:hypothetical protein